MKRTTRLSYHLAFEHNRKENEYETRKDIKYKKITEYSKKRWMRRMSDILPVCMQDFLYCRKPDM